MLIINAHASRLRKVYEGHQKGSARFGRVL